MALQILSDLHLEAPKAYDIFEIAPRTPYLALLGDIGNIASHKEECLAFFTKQLKQFRVVFFVPGNHEAYHSTWPETLTILRAFETHVRQQRSLGDFVLLDRDVFHLPDSKTVILGCSLFSHVPAAHEMAVSFGLNDFLHTEGWDVPAHNIAHQRDVDWLNAQVTHLQQSDKKIIILSHWSPTTDERSVDPKHGQSKIASAFSTDLSDQACFQSEQVVLWAFGHTHYNCDFTVVRKHHDAPLRLLANQRGYYFAQAEGFQAEKTVEI